MAEPTPKHGVHEGLLPPTIKQGTMSVVVTNGRDASLVAKVMRDPADLVKVLPKADFFLGWMDNIETFRKGIERDVSPELHAHLVATGHPI
jgi:hypothetical protein